MTTVPLSLFDTDPPDEPADAIPPAEARPDRELLDPADPATWPTRRTSSHLAQLVVVIPSRGGHLTHWLAPHPATSDVFELLAPFLPDDAVAWSRLPTRDTRP